MQPMLCVRSEVAGLLYVNGRLVGELTPEKYISLPVAPGGALFLEHRPLCAGYVPLARRMVLSGGHPLASALEGQDALEVIAWPGGVVEARITPERIAPAGRVQPCAAEGMDLRYIDGDPPHLEFSRGGETLMCDLPAGAQPPCARRLGGCVCLTGDVNGGRYLVALSEADLARAMPDLAAREIELSDEGWVRAVADMGDGVGHARLMRWALAGGQARLEHVETLWAQGAPRWPDSPEDTALAALQAARLGLWDEAGVYCAPGFDVHGNQALADATECDAVLPLNYPLPDGRPAVGLVRFENMACARVRAVCYHALPMGGPQGAWRLDRLELCDFDAP